METNNVDLPKVVTPESKIQARERESTAPVAADRARSAAPATKVSTVSLEVSVELKVELRALRSQQRHLGTALRNAERGERRLERLGGLLGRMASLAHSAFATRDPEELSTYEDRFRDLLAKLGPFGERWERTTGKLEYALARIDSESTTTLSSLEVDRIGFRLAVSGIVDFSDDDWIRYTMGGLSSVYSEVATLRESYRELGARLATQLAEIHAEIGSIDAEGPSLVDAASAVTLAQQVRDDVLADAQRANLAQAVPQAIRVLDLLEE